MMCPVGGVGGLGHGRRVTAARWDFVGWAGGYAGMPELRVTLTEEDAGTTLTAWPELL